MAGTNPTARRALLAWAELTGLWVLAFAQQAFGRIASGPEAFTQVGADRLDVLLLVALVALLPPTLAWLVELAIGRLRSPGAARLFHAALFGLAIGYLLWRLGFAGRLPDPVGALAAIALAGVAARLYLGAQVVRHFTELVSLATPVVIAAFLFTYPTSAQVLPSKRIAAEAAITARTPVVLIVFDEFPLDSLLTEGGRIDARLFPNFARLARNSAWYPNARAVTASTVRAVPTIMSGRLPKSGTDPPLSSRALPDNLCALLKGGGYRLHTLETITGFCGTRHSRPERLEAMLSRTFEQGADAPSGSIPTFSGGRAEEFDRFIDTISADRRSFNFAHPMLPHRRWMYMPDGSTFAPDPDPWALLRPQRDFLYQQVMLQIGFVDREIGRLIARMKAKGIWRGSLLVVTADHGLNMTFRGQADDLPDTGRPTWDSRDLTAENAGALLPIPLLVKYPNQTRGRVEPSEATSADIAPTILDRLGVTPPDPDGIDGQPLDRTRPERIEPIAALARTGHLTVPRATYAESRQAAERLRRRLFGDGTFFAPGGHPELLGTPVTDHPGLVPLAASPEHEPARPDRPVDPDEPTYRPDDPAGRWLLRLDRQPPGSDPALAVTLDGTIAATARPWPDPATGRWTVGVILPRTAFRDGHARPDLYLIPAP